jgi:hypothetical protein
LDVLPLRQNMVSPFESNGRWQLLSDLQQVTSLYVVLFAVAHAARSRTPLPQFMTSPIEAVDNWIAAVQEHLNSGSRSRSRSRSRSPTFARDRETSPELAVLYAFAEREALSQLSHCVVDVS